MIMLKVIVFNVRDKERLDLYNEFFKTAGFDFLGVLSDQKDFDCCGYRKIFVEELSELAFDYIMAHKAQLNVLYRILDKRRIPQSKARLMYYDFNDVQKVLGETGIKALFYDKYDIANGKLVRRLGYKRWNGKFTENISNLSK